MDDEELRLVSFALGSYSPAAEARVLAMHQVGDYAGVWLRTADDSGQGDDLVIAERRGGGWSEMTSGSGSSTWTAFPLDESEEERGVLAVLGEVRQPGTVTVQCDDVRATRVTDGRYWVVVFVGVAPNAMNGVSVKVEAVPEQS